MKIKLPFKTRRQLKAEIEHLTEQLRIETDARLKDAAKYRGEITDLEDKLKFFTEHAGTLEDRLEQLLDAERTINYLKKQLNEQKGINAGFASTITELKERNKNLASKIARIEEEHNTYVAKKKGGKQ